MSVFEGLTRQVCEIKVGIGADQDRHFRTELEEDSWCAIGPDSNRYLYPLSIIIIDMALFYSKITGMVAEVNLMLVFIEGSECRLQHIGVA